eukprot:622231-Hanusia_phi.AAC.1
MRAKIASPSYRDSRGPGPPGGAAARRGAGDASRLATGQLRWYPRRRVRVTPFGVTRRDRPGPV